METRITSKTLRTRAIHAYRDAVAAIRASALSYLEKSRRTQQASDQLTETLRRASILETLESIDRPANLSILPDDDDEMHVVDLRNM